MGQSRHSRGNTGLAVRTVMAVLSATAAAHADPVVGEMSAQRFEPAPGPRNFITVQGARTDVAKSWTGAGIVSFGLNPLVLTSCSSADCSAADAQNKKELRVVQSIVTGHALASFTPTPRLQLGLRVPFSFTHGDGLDAATGDAQRGGFTGGGPGDPAIEAKVRAVGKADSTLVLGASAFVSPPLGHLVASGNFLGDSSMVMGARGILDIDAKPFAIAFNVGGIYRGQERLGNVELKSAARYGVGMAFTVSPVLRLIAEGFGETRFANSPGASAVEADGALQVTPYGSRFSFLAGAGAGLVHGVGSPDFRGFGGLSYTHETGDRDHDGIADERDGCPDDAEDRDAFQDDDGCPELDNDRDGVPDAQDKCPDKPETVNGFQDEDGCPDETPDRDHDGIADNDDMCPDDGGPNVIRAKGPFYGCTDRDKDGVPDKQDKCPDEPEDTDGFQDEDGCPDPDNDQDGIPDVEDECPNEPGTREMHGCPDPDRDGDGIPDRLDKCPDKPETYNGYQDEDGCPDNLPNSLVEVTDDGIKIKEQVQFATASDKIVGPKSFKILDQVASVLKADQNIFEVEVAGHTDDVGDPESNKALSKKRAEAVRKYLVEKGRVPARKLSAAGYGSDKPLDDAKTADARKKNRRVEFVITKSKKKGAGVTPPAPAKKD
jgi:outer membrane protein OmpA-like peptidoglycan-associated protein